MFDILLNKVCIHHFVDINVIHNHGCPNYKLETRIGKYVSYHRPKNTRRKLEMDLLMIIDGNVIREMLAKTAKECIKDSKCHQLGFPLKMQFGSG